MQQLGANGGSHAGAEDEYDGVVPWSSNFYSVEWHLNKKDIHWGDGEDGEDDVYKTDLLIFHFFFFSLTSFKLMKLRVNMAEVRSIARELIN